MTKQQQEQAIKDGNTLTVTTDDNIEVEQFSVEKEEKKIDGEVKTEVANENVTPVQNEALPPQEEVAPIVNEEPVVSDELPKPDKIIGSEPNDSVPVSDLPAIEQEPVTTSEPEQTPQPFIPIDINGIDESINNPSIVTTPEYEVPTFEQPIKQESFQTITPSGDQFSSFSSTPVFSNTESANENNNDLFSNIYNNEENDAKVIATVVTKEDEIAAKKANMKAYEQLYDAGPGNQISILRNFSEEASKWITAVSKSGFVSGEMHDIAKKILREYEGLQNDNDSFTDDNDKIIPFSTKQSGNIFNQQSTLSSDDNGSYYENNNDTPDNNIFAA